MTEKPAQTPPLRLLAEDADDLQVISAALQDAITAIGQILYEPHGRRLTISLNRFCWECSEKEPIRIRAGLQFGGVLGVKSRDVPLEDKAKLISVLALSFEPKGEGDPGGAVTIHLACGGDIRVEVECIDAVLSDISAPWPAQAAPTHQV